MKKQKDKKTRRQVIEEGVVKVGDLRSQIGPNGAR